jgi:hypothetical protein
VAGNKLTAAQLNSNVRDAVNFLIAPPAVALTQSASQSIPTAAFTALTWDTEGVDSDNMHSTTVNTDRITAVTAGWYLVTAAVEFATSATGARIVNIKKNGTSVLAGNNAGPESFQMPQSVTCLVFLAVGDYVQALAYQASGGSLGTIGATGVNGGTNFSAVWVHS